MEFVIAQLHDHKTAHGKLDWLHGEILKWVDSIELDYRA
jgi:hypothetical protein